MIENQHLLLSAILVPSDSNRFMLCPGLCHSFKSCALPLSLPLHKYGLLVFQLSPRYFSVKIEPAPTSVFPGVDILSVCFNRSLGILKWLLAPPSIFQQSPTHNLYPRGIFISQCLPSRPLSSVSYWEEVGTCYTPSNKNSGSQLVWEIWGPGETYPKPPNSQGSGWAQGASAGTTVPVSPSVQMGERNCFSEKDKGKMSFSLFLS